LGASDAGPATEWLKKNGEHPRFEAAFMGFLDGYAKDNLERDAPYLEIVTRG
jgi:hypothetical protein